MKKNKLIALLLAVITVMQVFPVFALPIIAEDDIEGLSSDEMEVGKLYRAVWDYSDHADCYLFNDQMEQMYGSAL